jgi:hypothetical protein
MAGPIGKVGFKIIGMAIGVPAGMVVNKTLRKAWVRSRGSQPPGNPKSPDTDWLEAVTWAGVSAAVLTAGQVVVARSSEAVYRFLTGAEPPGREPAEAAAKS